MTFDLNTPFAAKRSRIFARASWFSLTHSAMMSRAPARASSTVSTPFSASTKAAASAAGSVLSLLGKEKDGQGLEPLLLCDGGPGAALGPEGQIDVLEDRHRLGGANLRLQLFRQELALAQGFEDGLAALVELGELLQAVADRGDGHLVEGARGLFAITGDEGHRAPLVEKAGNGMDLAGRKAELTGDLCNVGVLHEHLREKIKRQGPSCRVETCQGEE